MSSSQPRFPAEQLETFCARILEAVDIPPEHAAVTAKRLVEADARGRAGHGLIRLGPYVERIEAGGINVRPDIKLERETPTSALVDGDNGLGQVVVTRATELALAKAETSGMAWVGTVNSNHAGAAGLYPALAAARGMIGLYFAVANANGMPPWGGTRPMLGTNPLAVGVPAADGAPFLLDIATTVASHGSIKVKVQAGEPLPVGWLIDAEGEPVTDPARAGDGFLMPIGGYKGSGLNIAIGLLAGVMNGAAFGESVIDHREHPTVATNTGQSVFVMREDLFMPAEEMRRSVSAHLDELRQAGSIDGNPVRLPGDQAAEELRRSAAEGVPLSAAVVDQLRSLAERFGVDSLVVEGVES